MAISDNPTKTRGIEKAWRREINRRWARFTREVIAELNQVNRLTVNSFDADAGQLRAYMAFFQQKIDELIVGDWQEQYQRRSYNLAIQRAMAQLRRQGASTAISEIDRQLSATIGTFTATPSLGISALELSTFPIHQETLEFLFTRSFEALEGLTVDMARQVRVILFNGAEQGIGIRELTRQIRDRINVSKSRAQLIAQTETIQAFQRGTINQAEMASDFLDEPVRLRWDTRRDSKVRPLHVQFHGQIMEQAEARKKINISPFNCRCGLSPIIEESDTEADRARLKAEREQLISLSGG